MKKSFIHLFISRFLVIQLIILVNTLKRTIRCLFNLDKLRKKWFNGGFVNGTWRQQVISLRIKETHSITFYFRAKLSNYLFININKQRDADMLVTCCCGPCFKVSGTNPFKANKTLLQHLLSSLIFLNKLIEKISSK